MLSLILTAAIAADVPPAVETPPAARAESRLPAPGRNCAECVQCECWDIDGDPQYTCGRCRGCKLDKLPPPPIPPASPTAAPTCDCGLVQFRQTCPGGKCPVPAADPFAAPGLAAPEYRPAVLPAAYAPAYSPAPANAPAAGTCSAGATRTGPVRRLLGCLFRRCR